MFGRVLNTTLLDFVVVRILAVLYLQLSSLCFRFFFFYILTLTTLLIEEQILSKNLFKKIPRLIMN